MTEIVIYTKESCPFCVKAKQLLKRKNAAFQEIEISGRDDLKAEMIKKSAGRSTVPQIFINGELIGGCDDLYALEHAGKLDAKL